MRLSLSALIASVLVFLMLRQLGGDAATVILGDSATPESLASLREELGLNKPLASQYFDWIFGFIRGDLGESYGARYDIAEEILARLPVTLSLAFGALLISLTIALVAGTYSAIHMNQKRGLLVDVVSQIGISVPAFWGGLLLILLFSVRWGWLPAGGYTPWGTSPWGAAKSLALPMISISIARASTLTRYVRSSMIEVLSADYIRTSMATGRSLGNAAVVHGLKNASIPLVTVATLQFGSLLLGSVVIENVFTLPGIGRMFVVAVSAREVVVVQSLALVIILMILVLNFAMDLTYGLLDPRIRDSDGSAA